MTAEDDRVRADMVTRIERLEAQRELQELDVAWAKQRRQLMDRDGDGRLRAPAGGARWVAAGLAFAGAGTLVTSSGANMGLFLVAIGSAFLVLGVPYASRRRRAYLAARSRYELRRERLTRDDARVGSFDPR